MFTQLLDVDERERMSHDQLQVRSAGFDVRRALGDLRPELFRRAFLLSQDRQRADDLTQAAIERALLARECFQCPTNLSAWLKVVLRNMFIDERRHAALHADMRDEPADSFDHAGPGPVDLLLSDDVVRALGCLSARDAEVVTLAYIERRSYLEISTRLGIPANTVATRLHRAKGRLRKVLQVDYVTRLSEIGSA